MSEAQKKLRDKYRKNRSKWILVQSIILVILTLLVLISVITYAYISKTYYVEYTEHGSVDYTVQLKDNEFYESAYQGKDHTYVGSLVDGVIVDLAYELNANTEDVYYDYSYSVVANLLVVDTRSDEAIFDNEYTLVSEKKDTHNTSSKLHINELVILDYDEYNDLANRFVTTYDLTDTKNVLVVTLKVNIYSDGAAVGSTTTNTHTTALEIPLTDKTVDIKTVANAPTQDVKTIACDAGSGKEFFKIFAIIIGVIDVLAAGFMATFIYLTRTKDITYASKLQKLISRYKSYIQKILTPFDMYGYQVLTVDTFDEMLEIRDTIQEPILMYENDDKTCTQFIIPTNTMLVYLYTLAVEDMDDIYGDPDPEPTVEEPVVEEEPTVEEEPVVEEPVIVPPTIEEPVVEEEPAPLPGEEDGVEVIGVIWPERPDHKIYRYDPDGEKVDVGDIVLVPSRDVASNKDVVREAEVAEPNHKVPADSITYPLKKIIRVVRRKAEAVFTAMILGNEETEND